MNAKAKQETIARLNAEVELIRNDAEQRMSTLQCAIEVIQKLQPSSEDPAPHSD